MTTAIAAQEWRAALHTVARHRFLPRTLWLSDGAGGHRRCDRSLEPDRWRAAAYADMPVITRAAQFPDGQVTPLCWEPAPSTVVRMLQDARLDDGMRVLELGTGCGFAAAVLSARLGDGQVVTVETDPDLAEQARTTLRAGGYAPAVRVGDCALGWAGEGPYDRIVASCAVRRVPPSWLEQTRPGGRIVVPWDTSWCSHGTLTLDVYADGSAGGRFAPYGSGMLLSGHRSPDVELYRDVLRAGQEPAVSFTDISPWAVAGEDLDAQFSVGLMVPGVWHCWDTELDEAHTRLWLATDDAASWASVDYDGTGVRAFVVRQFGPRRLWDEVAGAYRGWDRIGRPEVGRLGLTVTRDGGASVWLDTGGATPASPARHPST